jgi:DHA1 family multidrug resistance protein-like MFS transporter
MDPGYSPTWKRTLWVLFIAQLVTSAGFQAMFPFLPLYVKQLGSAYGLSLEMLAGMAYSAQAITMVMASPIWGAVADRWGRKLMMERAMFGGPLILLWMAFARSAEELVLLRALQGLITGTIAAANAMAAAVAPRERVGYAMGLLQVGLGAGIALGPLLGGALADAFGYRVTFYVTAGSLFLSGLLVAWGAEERFERRSAAAEARPPLLLSYRRIITAPGVTPVYTMRFLAQMGRYMILPVAPLFIQSLLISPERVNTITGLVSGTAAAFTTLSSLFLGQLSDRRGARAILVLCASLAGLLYFAHVGVSAAWQLLALQALVGIALGGVTPAISALLARLTPSDSAGQVYGLDNSIDSAGRAVAPLLGSAIAITWGLRPTYAFTGCMFLALAALANFAVKTQKRP